MLNWKASLQILVRFPNPLASKRREIGEPAFAVSWFVIVPNLIHSDEKPNRQLMYRKGGVIYTNFSDERWINLSDPSHYGVSFAIINCLFIISYVSSDLSNPCLSGVLPVMTRGEEASGVKWSVSQRFSLDPSKASTPVMIRRPRICLGSVDINSSDDPSGWIRLGKILPVHHPRLITTPSQGPLNHPVC